MRLRTRTRAGGGQRAVRTPPRTRRKGILFCPDCGHESYVDGDWVRDDAGGRTSYTCPDCGAVVVSQPTFPLGNAT